MFIQGGTITCTGHLLSVSVFAEKDNKSKFNAITQSNQLKSMNENVRDMWKQKRKWFNTRESWIDKFTDFVRLNSMQIWRGINENLNQMTAKAFESAWSWRRNCVSARTVAWKSTVIDWNFVSRLFACCWVFSGNLSESAFISNYSRHVPHTFLVEVNCKSRSGTF